MKAQYKGMLLALSAIALTQLGGCYILTVPIYTSLCSPGADAKVKKLEKERDILQKRYENKTKRIKTSIAKQKREIARSIKARNVGKAASQINALYRYTHPCGEDECEVKRGPSTYGNDYIIREEDIDRERDYIDDSADKLFNVSKAMLKRGRFGELETGLANLDRQFKYDSDRRKKFLKFRQGLKGAWLKNLMAKAKKNRTVLPGVALIQYNKAASLAQEMGDGAKAKQIRGQAEQFRQQLQQFYSYNVYIDSTSGPITGKAVLQLRKKGWGKRIRLTTRNDRSVKAKLSVQSTQPAFRIYNEGRTDSFKYSSGTRQVPNPKYKELQRNYNISADNYRRCSSACGRSDRCDVKKWNGGTSYGSNACGSARLLKAEMNNLNAQISSTSPTKSVTDYKQWRYKYTLHSHEGKSGVSYRVAHTDRRRPLGRRYTLTSTLTDREHPAYTHGDGGVRADPKSIPSSQQVWSRMESDLASEIAKTINTSFDNYLDGLLAQGGLSGDEARSQRLNGMVLYGLVTYKSLNKSYKKTLSDLSGIPNAVRFVVPGQKSNKRRR